MITTEQQYSFEYFANNNSFSVHREIVMIEDDKILGRQRVNSMAFLPGMVDELAEYLGDVNHPLVSYCNIIWTPDIIEAQRAIESLNNQ
jgi:hypothetical protein